MSARYRSLTLVGIAGIALIGFVLWARACSGYPRKPSSSHLRGYAPEHAGPVRRPRGTPAQGPTDLLSLIHAEDDAVAGLWRQERGKLVSPPAPRFARLRIPYRPPDEYDIEVTVERGVGKSSLVLGLVRGNAQFAIILDGHDRHASGIDLLDGQPFYQNDTTSLGEIFEQHKPAGIVCSVRNDGLAASVDGKTVIHWKGDYRRLSLFPRWQVPDPPCLFIGSWDSVFIIHRMIVKPISGPGMILR